MTEVRASQISPIELAAEQIGVDQADALEEGVGEIDADEGDAVFIEFVECLDASAAAPLPLRGVDHLPGLIMAQLYAFGPFD